MVCQVKTQKKSFCREALKLKKQARRAHEKHWRRFPPPIAHKTASLRGNVRIRSWDNPRNKELSLPRRTLNYTSVPYPIRHRCTDGCLYTRVVHQSNHRGSCRCWIRFRLRRRRGCRFRWGLLLCPWRWSQETKYFHRRFCETLR